MTIRKNNFMEKYLLSINLRNIFCFKLGDGIIDNEEFEYVLSEFGCSERVARQAFTIVTKVSE